MTGSRDQRLVRGEAGFSLPEMMVTILVMVVVLFALYNIFDMSVRTFSFGNDKVEAIENARLGVEKMEREIRAAYPVDKVATPSKPHVFFNAQTTPASSSPASPQERTITFGNDLPSGGSPPNRMIDPSEQITYELRDRNNISAPCPTSGTAGVCVLARRQGPPGGNFEPVADFVKPSGLTLQYLKSDLSPRDPSRNGVDIGVVRIKLEVNVNEGNRNREQSLTTDVDVRNIGA